MGIIINIVVSRSSEDLAFFELHDVLHHTHATEIIEIAMVEVAKMFL